MPKVKGCLLVGSLVSPDAKTSFTESLAKLPQRLRRVPDGECGSRHYFTMWQAHLFPPMISAEFKDNQMVQDKEYSPEQIEQGIAELKQKPMETGYDTEAIASYGVWKTLRDEGVIPPGVRFQVCIPTSASVVGPFVQRAFQKHAYPVYEEALGKAVKNIQEAIPHEDLSLQIDLAADTAFWEGVYVQPWFGEGNLPAVREMTITYITRMISWVAQDVELGIHNCYGDMGHIHFFEPTSLKAISERGLELLEKTSHPIAFFHAPVPLSATNSLDEYMAPIKEFYTKLRAQGGELYLGVVHYNDLEGTKKRIEAAGKVVDEFGISTECGMGRTPKEHIDDLFKIHAELSEPVL